MYIDGVFDSSFTTNPSGSFTSNANLAIGVHFLNAGAGGGAPSDVDQIIIYDRDLTAAEHLLIYNGGAGR
jgi:hypothetical protein